MSEQPPQPQTPTDAPDTPPPAGGRGCLTLRGVSFSLAGLGMGALSLGFVGAIGGAVIGAIVGWNWYYATFLAEIAEAGQGSGVFLLFLIPAFLITMIVAVVLGGVAGGGLGVAAGSAIGTLAMNGFRWGYQEIFGRSEQRSQQPRSLGRTMLAWGAMLGSGAVFLVLLVPLLSFALLVVRDVVGGSSDTAPSAPNPTAQAEPAETVVPREAAPATMDQYVHPEGLFALNVPRSMQELPLDYGDYTAVRFQHDDTPTQVVLLHRRARTQQSTLLLDSELMHMTRGVQTSLDIAFPGICDPRAAVSAAETWERWCSLRFRYSADDALAGHALRGYIQQHGDSVSMLFLFHDDGLSISEQRALISSFSADPTPALQEE